MRVPVKGFEEFYEVGDDGTVWSFHADGQFRHRSSNNRTVAKSVALKPSNSGAGYQLVVLCRPGLRRVVTVHRLVAENFIGPRPSPMHEINHHNGDKKDNRRKNIEWVTKRENLQHSYTALGRVAPWQGKKRPKELRLRQAEKMRGIRNPRAKLTKSQVQEIRYQYSNGSTQEDLVKIYRVSQAAISMIVNHVTWT